MVPRSGTQPSTAHNRGRVDPWHSTTDIPPPESATLSLHPVSRRLLFINWSRRNWVGVGTQQPLQPLSLSHMKHGTSRLMTSILTTPWWLSHLTWVHKWDVLISSTALTAVFPVYCDQLTRQYTFTDISCIVSCIFTAIDSQLTKHNMERSQNFNY